MNLFTFPKKAVMLFAFLLLTLLQFAYATNIQSTGVGGLWSNAASWSPAVVPNAGDIVTINSGSPIQMNAPAACATIIINAGGVLTMTSSITVTSSFTVNGTLNCNQGFILGACSFTLANNNNAFLMIGDPNGISTSPTALGNIENTGSRSFPSTANYIYNGTGNQTTGTGLPTNINGGGSFTINNTGTALSNIVTITAGTSTIQNVTLQSGNLSLNGKTITVNGTILNSGGNLDSSVRANGGTFIVQGATITGPTTFYNLTCNSSNSTITTSGLSSPLINGTLLINSRFNGTNSPRYAKGSTLSYAGTANNRGLEWNADLSTTPTIGVTQGYPDNVLITTGSDFDVCNYPLNGNDGAIPRGLDGDLTASAFTMLDWIPYSTSTDPNYMNPLLNQTGSFTVGHNMIINAGGNIHMSKVGGSGAFTVKGSLTINGASANFNLDSMTNAFTVDSGIIINNGTLNLGLPGVATKLTVTGDIAMTNGTINCASGTISLTGQWKRYGGTFNAQNGTVNFNGTSAQVITATPSGEVFNNMIINNAGDIGMTYSTTINGNLTFIQGLFLTYSSADVIIGPSGNIIGASQSTGWVARFSGGNLIRNITTTSPYLFAIGNINTYTPVTLTFSSVTTPGTVEMNTPGFNPVLSMPGIATYALSKTDYANWFWYIQQLSGTFGSYNADLNYGTASLQGSATVSTLKTGVYDGTNWTYPPSSGSGTTVTATGITPLNGALENIGLANSTCTPPAIYNVTGTGSYCTGSGLAVGLDNSQTGVNYQLQTAGPINVGTPIAGTGSPISFGNQTMGTYTVVATNAVTSTCTSNMAGSAIITMGIPTAPTYTGTPLAEICVNNTVNYTTQLGKSNYVWTVPGVLGTDYTIVSGGIGSTNPTVNLTWLTSGTKTVTVNYTSGSCTGATPATNTTVVDNLPVPTFTPAPSGSVCINSSVTYTTQTGQVFYSWTVPGIAGTDYTITSGGISNTDNTVTLTWLTSGTKTVTVNYYNNLSAFCAGATPANSTITVNALPTPTFTAEPGATTCSNSLVTYTTQSPETNYIWTIPGTPGTDYTIVSGGSNTDNTVTLKWLTAGNKTISINYTDPSSTCSAAGSTASSATTVIAGPDASNLTIISATNACPGAVDGSTVTVNSSSLASDTYTVIYNLSAPNATNFATATMIFAGGTGTFTIPSGSLHAAGSTTITITALENSNCNTNGLSTTGTVAVSPAAAPTFINSVTNVCDHTDITYSTQSGESNYVWNYSGILNTDYSIASGGNSTDSSVTLQWLNNSGTKNVSINYTNANGCAALNPTSITTKINNCKDQLYIPSAFVPNGKNPIWHIENSEDYPNMQVQIFDRWGHKVFECRGYTAWNGTYEGQNLSTGSYTYVINANDNRYTQVLKGTITIIR